MTDTASFKKCICQEDDVWVAEQELSSLYKAVQDGPEDRLSKLLPIFCCHLQTEEIDGIISVPLKGEYTPKMWHARISIDALTCILRQHLVSSNPHAPHWVIMINTLTEHWRSTLTWVDYLKSRCRRAVKMHTWNQTRADLFDSLLRFMICCVGHPQSPLANALPDGFPLLGQLWLLQADEPYLARAISFPTQVLYDRLVAAHPNSEIVSDMMEWTGATMEEIAGASLVRVRRYLRVGYRESLDPDISLLAALCGHNQQIHKALADANCVSIVSRTLARIVEPSSSESPTTAGFISELCSLNLRCIMNTVGGPALIIQMLESGFIPAVLRYNTWLTGNTVHILALLSEILPRYLIYGSVIRAVGRELRKVERLRLEEPMKRTGDLWKYWVAFKAMATQLIRLLNDMIYRTCNNKQVRYVSEIFN